MIINMKKSRSSLKKIFVMFISIICLCNCLLLPLTAEAANNTSTKIIMLKGSTETASFDSSAGTVKCSSSNKKIVKPVNSGKNKFKIKALKNGTARITFKSDKIKEDYTIVVASGNAYVNKWTKNIATEIRKTTKDTKQQLILASEYIVGNFTYANVYDMKKVISKRKGNCYSAGQVLAKIYKALGYKAQVRSAIRDKKSRYPSNLIMGSDHYNVKVVAKKTTYYLDATPAMGFVYISNSKKPLAEYMNWGGNWLRIM